jgi:hypothetical protein
MIRLSKRMDGRIAKPFEECGFLSHQLETFFRRLRDRTNHLLQCLGIIGVPIKQRNAFQEVLSSRGMKGAGIRSWRNPSSAPSQETTQPVVPESLCPSPGSLPIPDDLDSTRCQQSRSEDLEHLQAATKSPDRLPGDRIARAVWEYPPGNVNRVYRRRLPFPRSREGRTVLPS